MSPPLQRGLALVLMVAFGFGVWFFLGTTKSHASHSPTKPTAVKTAFRLPGTMYLSQDGSLFKLHNGSFTQLQSQAGWMQPALSPDGSHLLAIRRDFNYSELYLFDPDGRIVKALTHNASGTVELNHWSFYPAVSADGKTIFMSYDNPKSLDYRVDFAIWSFPIDAQPAQGKQLSTPNAYTGGDVSPRPLKSGALLYTKYDIDSNGKIFAQVWLKPNTGQPGKALTQPADDCGQPAISPDETRLAMICTGGKQVGRLAVASLDANGLGPAKILVDGTMAASPAWAPDGSGLAYLAPAGTQGRFQLWWLATPSEQASPAPSPPAKPSGSPAAGTPKPSPTPSPPAAPAPKQLTTDLDFDATSAPAWRS